MEKSIITQLYNQGIKLHRLVKNMKRPYTEGTFNGDKLTELISHNGNIGVITGEKSGIIVLDLDKHNENEQSGEQSLRIMLNRLNETLPETYTVKTPTGGTHIYLRLPKSWYGTRFNPKLSDYPQIDFRNNGQYVVAESAHLDYKDEKQNHIFGDYECVKGSPSFIAYAPDWLLEIYMKEIDPRLNKPRQLNDLGAFANLWGVALTDKPDNFLQAIISKMVTSGVTLKAVKRLAWYVNMTSIRADRQAFEEAYNQIFEPIKENGIQIERVNKLGVFLNMWYEGAGEGGRNIYLTAMIGRLFASGMRHEYVHEIGRAINRTACNPPLDKDEYNLIYGSMLKTEQRRLEDLKRRLTESA